jgi:molybdenum cofactor biosynthesis enzyme MoaA
VLLRLRLDKTAKQGMRVAGRCCNLSCLWCHQDYFEHDDFTAISNDQLALAVSRLIKVTAAREAHVRLAGSGEPTIVGLDDLVDLIVKLRQVPGVTKVKLTTNGVFLGHMARELLDAGINAVTVSLNSLERTRYLKYSRHDSLNEVLASIEKAYIAGLKLRLNTIYWKGNYDELDAFEEFSCRYGSLPIKFFDLLPQKQQDNEYYLPLSELEKRLEQHKFILIEQHRPYPKRIYELETGAVFEVKISGQFNNCPNLDCGSRDICLEGCRNSVRICLDGSMKPCGVRKDNSINLLDPNTQDSDIWNSLHSGGKIGYEANFER